jgi:uncharacterized protein DUF4342
MGAHEPTVQDRHGGTATPEGSSPETMKVRGDILVAKVKELLHEGSVRRITVKNDQGHTVMEIPVTAGLLVAVVAPVLTAVAAIAALAGNWEIEIHRSPEHLGGK